jgi:dynein heavy chain
MGKFYVEAPATGMDIMYKNLEPITPLVFVLSQGADPTQALIKFADEMGFGDKLNAISLGQGQGPKAEAMIINSKKEGEWVVLQNCHLAKSWMGSLEQIVLNLKLEGDTIHEDFRLFMTSMPASYFPVSVLQNSVKLTTEPPRGIRANVKRTFMELNDKYLDECKKPNEWRKLLFGVTFFHAVIQERRKFGPLGWNIRYEFNDSDLNTSFTMLRIFLDEQNEIPWDALVYQTGHINYGGRVTDDWDRRCLLTILQKYYSSDILDDSYKFNEDGTYFAPASGTHQQYLDYIDSLPLIDKPDIFGLHDNADIIF